MEFLLDPFQQFSVPLGAWAESGINWLAANFRWVFQAIRQPIDLILSGIEDGLKSTPPTIVLAALTLIGWQIAGRSVGIIVLFCMTSIGLIGAWSASMTTLAIVMTSIIFCSIVGIPAGILSARSDVCERILRPILDLMQTIPSFVYLVPVVMLFGIGNVPGVIVTIVYALPPVVRLTNLGIRQVPEDMTEAALAFGASKRQLLYKIQIPLALPTIMAGINQTIMMSLAMVVVASMISVTGLGQMVLRGIGRLDMDIATVGGAGIVLLAIAIDRISQGFGRSFRDRGHKRWYETGPLGAVLRHIKGKAR